MQIQAVKLSRSGGENDPEAEVVVEIQDMNGDWEELGREKCHANFSHIWSTFNKESHSFGDFVPEHSNRPPFSDEKWEE